jgi:DNA-binding transcriptional ArsR family regulator
MQNDKCIRECADHLQITRCKESIDAHAQSIHALSSIFNLAGNEVRFRILFLLSQEGELCPCDLSDILGMKIPAVSQHLRKLKDGGVVVPRKEGQTIFYSLAEANLPLLNPIFEHIQPQKIAV